MQTGPMTNFGKNPPNDKFTEFPHKILKIKKKVQRKEEVEDVLEKEVKDEGD